MDPPQPLLLQLRDRDRALEHPGPGLAVPRVADERLLQLEAAEDLWGHHHEGREHGLAVHLEGALLGLETEGDVLAARREGPEPRWVDDPRRYQPPVAEEDVPLVERRLPVLARRIGDVGEPPPARERGRLPGVAPE